MWIKWVTIHESYGLPRVAQECRQYLELQGIQVRLVGMRTRRKGHVYKLQVPVEQEEQARERLHTFKSML
ncbi:MULTISPECIES: hypothetical protein [Brevibacillus]|uniref:Uncharacterized protein n=1 Tax=Brevibacillus invocatus TaxID=173959 RepID=A0A3M8BWA0_9BACL|nr:MULTISPECIES: hypothetical protein [Brevibacillus]MCM3080992.1 hypothetical protein [Brevibacillus invocatus]MCM3431283.1 hypothetical protein [Brevibacillus invocatus]MDH4615731.1 hypothetical protein [Brevibacillus sp. AY1]RNB67307.1 hypothetical protein EDM52_22705 [Brevibacillus invocatus]